MASVATVPYRRRLVDPLLDELLGQLSAVLVVGPRTTGKTTTLTRRASTVIRLDRRLRAAAFEADPDAALRGLAEPVLLDEWQRVPGVLGAVRRAVEADPHANRFFVTGSVRAELAHEVWPATGRLVRVAMYPMTVGEQIGRQGQPFFDRIAAGEELSLPAECPDLRGYVELALRSGFPDVALRLTGGTRRAWLESYIEDLLAHDVEQIETHPTRHRDTQRLRRFLEAYALSSAGVADQKTIYEAAQVSKATASAYEDLLAGLLIAERVPAWSSNRLKRLVRRPKRYLIDAALMTTTLGLDEQAVIADGDMLGRVLDTFVAAQLRPELAIFELTPTALPPTDRGGPPRDRPGGRARGTASRGNRGQGQRRPQRAPRRQALGVAGGAARRALHRRRGTTHRPPHLQARREDHRRADRRPLELADCRSHRAVRVALSA